MLFLIVLSTQDNLPPVEHLTARSLAYAVFVTSVSADVTSHFSVDETVVVNESKKTNCFIAVFGRYRIRFVAPETIFLIQFE